MIGAVKKNKIKELCANKQISRGLTNHSPPQKKGGGGEVKETTTKTKNTTF